MVSAAFKIALKLMLGLREITNWKTEENRRILGCLQRRACHDRVVVTLLAGTEVSMDWERFPHFLRVRGEVGVLRSLSTRLPRKRQQLTPKLPLPTRLEATGRRLAMRAHLI